MLAMAIGMAIGIVINLTLADVGFVQRFLVDGLFHVVGAVFIAGLKMLVVPLVRNRS